MLVKDVSIIYLFDQCVLGQGNLLTDVLLQYTVTGQLHHAFSTEATVSILTEHHGCILCITA